MPVGSSTARNSSSEGISSSMARMISSQRERMCRAASGGRRGRFAELLLRAQYLIGGLSEDAADVPPPTQPRQSRACAFLRGARSGLTCRSQESTWKVSIRAPRPPVCRAGRKARRAPAPAFPIRGRSSVPARRPGARPARRPWPAPPSPALRQWAARRRGSRLISRGAAAMIFCSDTRIMSATSSQ